MDAVLERLNAAGVRYLLMGGQAVRLSGLPRYSMDWDLYVPPRDRANLARLNDTLADILDAPVEPLGPRGENFVQTYQTPHGILQFHLAGPGLPDFDRAEAGSLVRPTETGVPVRCLAVRDLLHCKRRAGRPQDLEDARYLELLLQRDTPVPSSG